MGVQRGVTSHSIQEIDESSSRNTEGSMMLPIMAAPNATQKALHNCPKIGRLGC